MTFTAAIPNAARIWCSLYVACTQFAHNCRGFQKLLAFRLSKASATGCDLSTGKIQAAPEWCCICYSSPFCHPEMFLLALQCLDCPGWALTSKISSAGLVKWSSASLSTQLYSGGCGQQCCVLYTVPGRKHCHQAVHSTQHCCL